MGGALTQLDWRLIFFINLPVGAIALALLTQVPKSVQQAKPFAWSGQIAGMISLGALMFGIIEGADLGYGDAQVLGSIALASVSVVVFVVAQARGRHPMVPRELFKSRAVTVGLGVSFVNMAAFCGVVFVQSLYFQQQRDMSPLATGLLFLPMSVLVVALNPMVVRAMERFGKLPTTIGGQVLVAAGLVCLSLLPPGAPTIVAALLMIPVGVGGSFTVPPLTALILDQVPADRAGTASGVLNTARQMGGSIGVAVFGAVLSLQPDFIGGLQLDFRIAAALVVAATSLLLRYETTEARRAL